MSLTLLSLDARSIVENHFDIFVILDHTRSGCGSAVESTLLHFVEFDHIA